jgi:hypothetical protein
VALELTADLERVAVHEAAHVAAGLLLNRPVDSAWLNEDGTGGSRVGTVRADRPIDLPDALDDLVVHLIGDLTHPATATRYYLASDEGTDEAQALSVAMRVSNSATEARAVVALGRARAQTLSEDDTFVALTEEIANELLANGQLDSKDIERIRKDFNNGTET